MRRDELYEVGVVIQRATERGLASELARANLIRGRETRRDPRERVFKSRNRRVERPSLSTARRYRRSRGRRGKTRTLRGDRQGLALRRGVLAAALRVGVTLVAPLRGGGGNRRARTGGRRARGGEQKRRRRRRAGQVAAQETLARDAPQRRHHRGGEAGAASVTRLGGGEGVNDVAARFRGKRRLLPPRDDDISRVRPRATRLPSLARVVVRRDHGPGSFLLGGSRSLPGTGAFGPPRHRHGRSNAQAAVAISAAGPRKGATRTRRRRGPRRQLEGPRTRLERHYRARASRRGTPVRSVVRARADERASWHANKRKRVDCPRS